MRLYHHPMSSNARRAVMTALHLGTELELVLVDLSKGEQRQPAFLKLNPNGKVPVLEDDGFVLSESHAIMQYLADRDGSALARSIYPDALRARANVNRWLFWSAYHFQPAVSVLGWENVVKPMLGLGAPDPKEVQRGEGLVQESGRVLDEHLADKEWIAEGRLTLADFAVAPPLASIERAKLPLKQYSNLLRWFDRVRALPAWQRSGM